MTRWSLSFYNTCREFEIDIWYIISSILTSTTKSYDTLKLAISKYASRSRNSYIINSIMTSTTKCYDTLKLVISLYPSRSQNPYIISSILISTTKKLWHFEACYFVVRVKISKLIYNKLNSDEYIKSYDTIKFKSQLIQILNSIYTFCIYFKK